MNKLNQALDKFFESNPLLFTMVMITASFLLGMTLFSLT